MAVTNESLVYAYPISVLSNHQWTSEIFVTFEEPNIFEDPYQTIELKIAATISWVLGFFAIATLLGYVCYEVQGYASSYRSIINQLVSAIYVYVVSRPE